MSIAYLVLCHTDPVHVARLSSKLTIGTMNHVFIHVDAKVQIDQFQQLVADNPSIHFVSKRFKVYWGGFSSVQATYALMRDSFSFANFDRFVLLQGLDYPLASNAQIDSFFLDQSSVEFIRGCNVTESHDEYFFAKFRYLLFFDRPNVIKKIVNKITRILKLKFKPGVIFFRGQRYQIFWGSAQWG